MEAVSKKRIKYSFYYYLINNKQSLKTFINDYFFIKPPNTAQSNFNEYILFIMLFF